MDSIRNKSEYVLKQMYKIHLDRIENNQSIFQSIFQSKYFGSCEELQNNYFLGFTFDELHDCINELSYNGFLEVSYGSNVLCEIILNNNSIAYFEDLYSKNIRKLINDLSKLRSIIGL